MAKLKKKNKVAKAAAHKDEDEDDDTALATASVGNDLAPDKLEVDEAEVNFAGEGESLFHVIKGDHSAIVRGDSKADAKEAFFKLFGIVDTNETIRVGKIDEDDLSSFKLNVFGVILGTS